MSTETRTVRPFVGLDGLQRILSAATLLVGPDRLSHGESVTLTTEGFMLRTVTLELAADDELFALTQDGLTHQLSSVGYDPADVEMVAVLSSPYLKIAEVALRCSLSDLAGTGRSIDVSGPDRPRALQSPRSGCNIDLYLVLSRHVERRPLKPWRKGTWLAHTSYSLSSELAPVGFTPRALTSELRAQFQLADDVVRYIVFEDEESPLEAGSSETSLAMYVDQDVLAKMSASSSTPGSQLFQLQLFLDAVRAILDAANGDETIGALSYGDLDDTLFGRLITGLTRRPGQTADDARADGEGLFDTARNQPDLFMAHAEAVVGYRKVLNEVLDQ